MVIRGGGRRSGVLVDDECKERKGRGWEGDRERILCKNELGFQILNL